MERERKIELEWKLERKRKLELERKSEQERKLERVRAGKERERNGTAREVNGERCGTEEFTVVNDLLWSFVSLSQKVTLKS